MARVARLISMSDYYHVMVRGNNKDPIFKNTYDKQFFIDKFMELESEGLIGVSAWCIMDNHAHIVMRAESENLSLAMKRINISYAMRLHRKYTTVGHIFQDRFKSETIESEESLLNVIRYVHQNPIKANLANHIKDYGWSSYNQYSSEFLGDTMRYALELFNNIRTFETFHQVESQLDFIDTKEDIRMNKERRAVSIIEETKRTHGVSTIKEIIKNKLVIRGMLERLKKESGLSLRSISKLVDIPYSTLADKK